MPKDNQSEIFVWVDENDQELGLITRGEAHNGTRKIHRAATVLIFNKDKTKILFQQRSLQKDTSPGKWSCGAGGHVSKGDSYDSTAKRELNEELGIFQNEIEFISKYLDGDEIEREYLSVFRACISEETPLMLDSTEVQTTEWCVLSKLQDFIATHSITPSSMKILTQLGYIDSN